MFLVRSAVIGIAIVVTKYHALPAYDTWGNYSRGKDLLTPKIIDKKGDWEKGEIFFPPIFFCSTLEKEGYMPIDAWLLAYIWP